MNKNRETKYNIPISARLISPNIFDQDELKALAQFSVLLIEHNLLVYLEVSKLILNSTIEIIHPIKSKKLKEMDTEI
jgi:hypothetical protein